MWSAEEAQQIRAIAEKERPGELILNTLGHRWLTLDLGIKTHAIPQGLQVDRGPDAIVEYLLENVPPMLDSVEL